MYDFILVAADSWDPLVMLHLNMKTSAVLSTSYACLRWLPSHTLIPSVSSVLVRTVDSVSCPWQAKAARAAEGEAAEGGTETKPSSATGVDIKVHNLPSRNVSNFAGGIIRAQITVPSIPIPRAASVRHEGNARLNLKAGKGR